MINKMAQTSVFTIIGFLLTTIVTLWLFFKATESKKALFAIFIWMLLTAILGFTGFYKVTNTFPPRFLFLLGPGILFVIIYLFTKQGGKFSESLNIKWLTLLHTVRLSVEFVLYYVFLEGLIPDLMTFEGYNFDILSGITAPVFYYFVFVKKSISKKGLLIWNFICLGLLVNILTIALLSAQTPFQKLAFHQPNIGVTFFPFVWLPAVIVPIVLFSHLASIKQLIIRKNETDEFQL